MGLGMDVDPGKLPRDWRTVVRVGAFILLGVFGVAVVAASVAAPIAEARVAPVASWLSRHESAQTVQDRTDAATLQEIRDNVRAARRQTEALCRATPKANCPLLDDR